MDLLLLLLVGLGGSLVLGEPAAEGTGELGAEVKREELLVLVEEAELGALVGVDDGEDTSDRLADVVAVLYILVSGQISSSGCCAQSLRICGRAVPSLFFFSLWFVVMLISPSIHSTRRIPLAHPADS